MSSHKHYWVKRGQRMPDESLRKGVGLVARCNHCGKTFIPHGYDFFCSARCAVLNRELRSGSRRDKWAA